MVRIQHACSSLHRNSGLLNQFFFRLGKLPASAMHFHVRSFTAAAVLPSLSTTSTKIKHLISQGLLQDALHIYKHLHSSGSHGHRSFLPSLLKASSSSQFLPFGLQLHCVLLKAGHSVDQVVANAILSMYSRCSHVESACQVFDTMPLKDSVSWNSMIMCYVRHGFFVESVQTFKEMLYWGFEASPELTASVVTACRQMGNLSLGREIHAHVVCGGMLEMSVLLSTALVDLYLKCSDVHTALRVFERMPERNVVSWTAMIDGCVANGQFRMSIEAFQVMQIEGVKPNRITLVTVLPSCAESGVLKYGKEVHGYALRRGFDMEPDVNAALIDAYCKSGASREPLLLFERANQRDVVMWSSAIGSFSQGGDSVCAMNLFNRMRREGLEPNYVTILVILEASIRLLSVSHGQGIHGYTVKYGLSREIFVENCLIDLYSKCGCLQASRQVFDEMAARDPVTWSTMIFGYGLHGFGTTALQLFHDMQNEGIKPDEIAWLSVLTACNHAGLVDEGQKLFNHVVKDKSMNLGVEHFACYINLLGRYGKVEDACKVISNMPMKASPRVWSSLASACRVHGKFEVAEKLAHKLIHSEPENAANYTVLSVIYAEVGNWYGMDEVRRIMREKAVTKSYGWSQIQVQEHAAASFS